MGTVLYSLLHFLVDFACAWAMFSRFIALDYASILVYNFCAFALQLPLGTLADLLVPRCSRLPAWYVLAGAALVAVGCGCSPVLLGLGNALFHVGGGIAVIREDTARGWSGRALGMFVAPGALGLYLGQVLPGVNPLVLGAGLLGLAGLSCFVQPEPHFVPPNPGKIHATPPKIHATPEKISLLCCVLVVILRSYVGMAASFSWKSGSLLALASVLAAVLGKAAGGLLSAQFSPRKTAVFSLLFASIFYYFADFPLPGLLAIFCFNMTMPITLYRLYLRCPALPGFSFGLLTFSLFLGFLPIYFGVESPISSPFLGSLTSLVSLVLLLPVTREEAPCTI